MMQAWRVLLGAGLGLLLAGCAGPSRTVRAAAPATPASGFPLTLEDDSGRKVTLKAPPRRIISLAGAHTETLYALGLGDRIVAADRYSDYPPEVKPKATLNCWPRPPAERIVALRPDLVVVFTEGEDFARLMERAGIPVLKLFPTSFAGTLERIRLLGQATGRSAGAETLVARMRGRVSAVRAGVGNAPLRRVLFEIDATDPGRPYVAGGAGVYGELLTMAGGENVFAALKLPAAQVSTEAVVAKDPEVILLGDANTPVRPQKPADVARRPGWSRISAVRAGRIFPVASERITRPGPRLVEGLEEIARRVHPERFP
jgi:iron complex transport system substrate-binding protein